MNNGQVALVSGGNRGIGLEVCRQLAERSYTVVMGSRDDKQGRTAAAGLPDGVIVRQLDVADPESVPYSPPTAMTTSPEHTTARFRACPAPVATE